MRDGRAGKVALVACLTLLANFQLNAGIFQLDEGERLSEQIANTAKYMRKSRTNEMTIVYTPKKGVDQHYSVQLAKVTCQPRGPMKPPYAGLTVLVEKGTGGFCNRHVLFVSVPRSWNITKQGISTTIVLRRAGEEIAVADVR